jgi:hypothetical protein
MPEGGFESDIAKEILKEAVKVAGTAVYNSVKEKFLKFWNEDKFKKDYGFPYSIEDAKEVYAIGQSVSFKTLKECIGNKHWALNFIKVGIRISDLSDKGEREKVDLIRGEIRKTKGLRPINIVNMGSTGAIKGIVNYLDSLRMKEYSREAIIEEFERIIYDWENVTIFVDKGSNKETIKSRIVDKVDSEIPLFFIFSYGLDASQIAMYSIAELRNEGLIEPNGYILDTQPRFDGVGTIIYMWTLEYCKNTSS